ncbi:hypothetical protein DFH06DRAFT_1347317 [Mycena polygramma]|nr:hypothetical protein DFH06DRAFT_1347317 [Mycena polygramma]
MMNAGASPLASSCPRTDDVSYLLETLYPSSATPATPLTKENLRKVPNAQNAEYIANWVKLDAKAALCAHPLDPNSASLVTGAITDGATNTDSTKTDIVLTSTAALASVVVAAVAYYAFFR